MQLKINIVWVCVIAVGALFFLRECGNSKESNLLYETAQDTLQTERLKNGQQKATIASMKGKNTKLFLQMKTKDSSIIHLQKQVKEYKGKVAAAVYLETETEETGSTATVVIDTTEAGDPVYFSEWVEEWSSGSITASKDSISRNIKFRSDFEVIIGEKKNKLFRKPEMKLQVISLNPNTTTQAARSFVVQSTQKRLNLGLQAGYGVNLLTFKPVFYAGFGFSYTLISLK